MSISTSDVRVTKHAVADYEVAQVDALAPITWIRRGIEDLSRMPRLSLLYGSLFAALCASVFLLSLIIPWYTLGYLTGLVIVGPFLASGLYTASRDIERGATPGVTATIRLIRDRKTYLAMFSLMLALVMAAWVRFSALLLAVTFNSVSVSANAFLNVFASPEGWYAIAYFLGVGLILAIVVFTISAVAIPLIFDKDVDFITAMQASFRAVTQNRRAMTVWAGAIVLLTAIGVATAFVGLAFVFPVLGYATWHSYRALLT